MGANDQPRRQPYRGQIDKNAYTHRKRRPNTHKTNTLMRQTHAGSRSQQMLRSTHPPSLPPSPPHRPRVGTGAHVVTTVISQHMNMCRREAPRLATLLAAHTLAPTHTETHTHRHTRTHRDTYTETYRDTHAHRNTHRNTHTHRDAQRRKHT